MSAKSISRSHAVGPHNQVGGPWCVRCRAGKGDKARMGWVGDSQLPHTPIIHPHTQPTRATEHGPNWHGPCNATTDPKGNRAKEQKNHRLKPKRKAVVFYGSVPLFVGSVVRQAPCPVCVPWPWSLVVGSVVRGSVVLGSVVGSGSGVGVGGSGSGSGRWSWLGRVGRGRVVVLGFGRVVVGFFVLIFSRLKIQHPPATGRSPATHPIPTTRPPRGNRSRREGQVPSRWRTFPLIPPFVPGLQFQLWRKSLSVHQSARPEAKQATLCTPALAAAPWREL